jgi:hypothetical protein
LWTTKCCAIATPPKQRYGKLGGRDSASYLVAHDVRMGGKRNPRRPLTNAERQAKWRLAHGRAGLGQPTVCTSPAELLPACIPSGSIELPELEKSAAATLALYNKLVAVTERWVDDLDNLSPAVGLKAFSLLAPALESIAILRAKIIEQRGTEARDVTAQAAPPKIEETLEYCAASSTTLRSRRQPEHEPVTVLK